MFDIFESAVSRVVSGKRRNQWSRCLPAVVLPLVCALAGSPAKAITSYSGVPRLADLRFPSTPEANPAAGPNVIYVSPTGTTLQQAINMVNAGTNGQYTVVLRTGSYKATGHSINKKAFWRAAQNERPWIIGSSRVTSWASAGTSSSGTPIWSRSTVYERPGSGESAYNNYEQVFVNGQPQVQNLNKSSLSAGQFAIDYTNHVMYLCNAADPNSADVQVTTENYGLSINAGAADSTFRGIGFAYFGDTTFYLKANGTKLQRCVAA